MEDMHYAKEVKELFEILSAFGEQSNQQYLH